MRVRLATRYRGGRDRIRAAACTVADPDAAGERDRHPDMKKSGKIKKQTNPHKNGISESESPNGGNKNGQSQQ